MNIWFVGRCLSWPHVAHNFSQTHFLWMSILFSFSLYDWDFLLVLPLDWRSQGELGVNSSSSVWVTCSQMYLTVCFNNFKVWVTNKKKWRMNCSWCGTWLVVSHYSSRHKNDKLLHLANKIINLSQLTSQTPFVKYEYNLDDSKKTMSGLQYNWQASYMPYHNRKQGDLD